VVGGRPGRQWWLPLTDRVLLVEVYYRTNLTIRQIAPLFGITDSAAFRIIDRLDEHLALAPIKGNTPATVLIADGTLVPTRDTRHRRAQQELPVLDPTCRSSSTPSTASPT
jgi:hypothetical protein